MNHTPAPWNISRHATPEHSPQFGIYAENQSPGRSNDHATVHGDNAEADARLIAAAPKMLLFLFEITERKDIPRDARNAAHTLIDRIGLAPNPA